MINILQLQTDSAGNQGWVLMEQIDSSVDALAHIQALHDQDGLSYAAELITDVGSQRIAEIKP